jgi:hypothetical protein
MKPPARPKSRLSVNERAIEDLSGAGQSFCRPCPRRRRTRRNRDACEVEGSDRWASRETLFISPHRSSRQNRCREESRITHSHPPVDPKHKTFVWMAVIELVEQARLTFTTDVNRYLRGVRIPTTLPGPIALEDLVMHTAPSDRGSGRRRACPLDTGDFPVDPRAIRASHRASQLVAAGSAGPASADGCHRCYRRRRLAHSYPFDVAVPKLETGGRARPPSEGASRIEPGQR